MTRPPNRQRTPIPDVPGYAFLQVHCDAVVPISDKQLRVSVAIHHRPSARTNHDCQEVILSISDSKGRTVHSISVAVGQERAFRRLRLLLPTPQRLDNYLLAGKIRGTAGYAVCHFAVADQDFRRKSRLLAKALRERAVAARALSASEFNTAATALSNAGVLYSRLSLHDLAFRSFKGACHARLREKRIDDAQKACSAACIAALRTDLPDVIQKAVELALRSALSLETYGLTDPRQIILLALAPECSRAEWFVTLLRQLTRQRISCAIPYLLLARLHQANKWKYLPALLGSTDYQIPSIKEQCYKLFADVTPNTLYKRAYAMLPHLTEDAQERLADLLTAVCPLAFGEGAVYAKRRQHGSRVAQLRLSPQALIDNFRASVMDSSFTDACEMLKVM